MMKLIILTCSTEMSSVCELISMIKPSTMRKKKISVYKDDSHGASDNVEGEDYESRGADSMETIKAILDGGGARRCSCEDSEDSEVKAKIPIVETTETSNTNGDVEDICKLLINTLVHDVLNMDWNICNSLLEDILNEIVFMDLDDGYTVPSAMMSCGTSQRFAANRMGHLQHRMTGYVDCGKVLLPDHQNSDGYHNMVRFLRISSLCFNLYFYNLLHQGGLCPATVIIGSRRGWTGGR